MQDEESDDDPIVFDDLPVLASHDIISAPEAVDIEVQRKPVAGQLLLSRPQPASHPPVRFNSPEQGILYPAFVRMVD